MNNPAPSGLLPESTCDVKKRVILPMGGKGGVGKTSIMVGLAEWFAFNLTRCRKGTECLRYS
jgi:Mrp family chromosome partitioning ATPase